MTVYVEFLPYPGDPEDMIRTVLTVILDEVPPFGAEGVPRGVGYRQFLLVATLAECTMIEQLTILVVDRVPLNELNWSG
jgi:hypothetical protein